VKVTKITGDPGYNDMGACDTSSIASDILWYQLIPHFQHINQQIHSIKYNTSDGR